MLKEDTTKFEALEVSPLTEVLNATGHILYNSKALEVSPLTEVLNQLELYLKRH